MADKQYYEIEYEPANDKSSNLLRSGLNLKQVKAFIESIQETDGFILVADIEGNVDYGNFILGLKNDLASVQLNEHCEHFASDPNRLNCDDELVCFYDETSIKKSDTVTREQGLDALYFWLGTREKTDRLRWS